MINIFTKGPVYIETERLIIRNFNLSDADDMYNFWASDDIVTKYLRWTTHQNVEESLEVIRRFIDDTASSLNLAIVLKETKHAIGSIALYNRDERLKKASIGYCISRHFWNRGITTEALNAIIKYAFTTLDHETLCCCHNMENPSSGRVMTKCNMRYVGIISSNDNKSNKEIHECWYELTKTEYLNAQQYSETFVLLDNSLPPLKYKGSVNTTVNLNTIRYTISSTSEVDFMADTLMFKEYYEEYIIGDNNLSLEKMIINLLVKHEIFLSAAESCTGGMLISRLIGVSGASNAIGESYVTYSPEAKIKILKVNPRTIDKHSVVSYQVAEEMANGLAKISGSEICISVTGYAGSGSYEETDGLFFFCIKTPNYEHVERHQVQGNREECRFSQTTYILWRLLSILKKYQANTRK